MGSALDDKDAQARNRRPRTIKRRKGHTSEPQATKKNKEKKNWPAQGTEIGKDRKLGKHDRECCRTKGYETKATRRERTIGFGVPSIQNEKKRKSSGGAFMDIIIRGDCVDTGESA
jgi:hypothetical protein